MTATSDSFISSVPLFSSLSAQSLDEVARRATTLTIQAGDYLFHQGDPSDSMYVLGSGRLEVIVTDPDPVVARELGPGDAVGELGVLTGAARSSSIRAKRDCELVRIDQAEFTSLLEQAPGVATELARALARQLQASRGLATGANPLPTVIAVASLGGSARAREFADRLNRALGRHGTVALLSAQDAGALDRGRLARMVDEQERQHGRILMVAEAGDPPEWHDVCLRQADRVLALVDARDPLPGRPLHPRVRGCDLINYRAPSHGRLDPWLDAVEPAAVHALPGGQSSDGAYDALARRLAGRSVGLVLGGGGARGCSHIGVFEALAEAGVPVDRVAGCSIGALGAAAFATGLSTQEMIAGWQRDMIATNPLGDYTVPAVALVRGAKLRKALRNQFGSTLIEDLPHEFFCVSADIYAGELYVHRRGPLVDAIYASMAIPGLLPPARVDGRLLVDGGVLNNLPVHVLLSRGAGPVVASDLTVERADRQSGSASRRLWRWEVVQAALSGAGHQVPPIRETLMRALLLGSVDATRAEKEQADVVITPDTRGMGLLEFGALERGLQRGREAAREALSDPEARRRLLLDVDS